VRGVYGLFIAFDTIIWVWEPNYGVVCLSLSHVGFQEKMCFELMGWDIIVIDEYNYQWCRCSIYLNIWEGINYKGDFAQNFICDLFCLKTWGIPCMSWYVCMWNMIAYDVDDGIEMRWCWCWWLHWDEMMLMLMMILRWDDIDVNDDIEMNDVGVDDDIEIGWCWCWWCRWDECMLCMYMGL